MKIILEMANNHMGSVEHGKLIIDEFAKVIHPFKDEAEFFLKFQYRELDTYLDRTVKGNTEIHYVKRFESTRLTNTQFDEIKEHAKKAGFKLACTPFDLNSAKRVVNEGYDLIKIASACIDDWQIHTTLIDEIKKRKLDCEITFSTGGATVEQVDRLASFYNKRFAGDLNILHCVASYPYEPSDSLLGKIPFLRERYPFANIGYSAHELPDQVDLGAWSYLMGARIFEKHVAVDTEEYKNNKYSIRPAEFKTWLTNIIAAKEASKSSQNVSEKELKTVYALKRGATVSRDIKKGEQITSEDVFYTFPREEGQLGPEDYGMFRPSFYAEGDLSAGDRIYNTNVSSVPGTNSLANEQIISEFVHKAKGLLRTAGIRWDIDCSQVELSHHYGIEKLEEFGALLITRINTELYSKKIVVQTPGQRHPTHTHFQKDETFELLHGDLEVTVDGKHFSLKPGEQVRVKPGQEHSFSTVTGAVFEEIATTAISGDSKYKVENEPNRKSKLNDYWERF